jgi:hypothetical protein
MILPWLLILLLDATTELPTTMRFATESQCIEYGESLSLAIRVDLQLTQHTVDPKCVRRP